MPLQSISYKFANGTKISINKRKKRMLNCLISKLKKRKLAQQTETSASSRDVARAGLGGLKPPNLILAPHPNEFQPMKCH